MRNKRLDHALAIVKDQQELKLETKVLTNSEKTGYKKRRRILYASGLPRETRSRAAVE